MLCFNRKLTFKIVTDDYKYASKLLPEYEIIEGDIKSDFMHLYFSQYSILSNSSFAYFPTKLGAAPLKVIAPNHWARFGNKHNRWVSPCNQYSDWLWQNTEGRILNKEEIDYSLSISKKIYSEYNILISENKLKKFNLKDLLPEKLKKFLKRKLSNIFPLFIG